MQASRRWRRPHLILVCVHRSCAVIVFVNFNCFRLFYVLPLNLANVFSFFRCLFFSVISAIAATELSLYNYHCTDYTYNFQQRRCALIIFSRALFQ